MKSASENIDSIISMKSHGAFQKYIDFIHFPFYRNMEINSRINFDFPLTAIVGQNGCGKSSVLHAISGIPLWKTPSKFWFDTDVDPIIYYNDERKRHSFWYQFEERGITKQVLKARIKRRNNPNNWETNRPLLWAGMKPSPNRETPIEKNLIYIDFRSELSAFDKFFYFGFYKKEEAKNKQEFIRDRSGDLSKAFGGEIIKSNIGKDLNTPVEILNNNELDAISFILGRKYIQAKSVDHSIFRNRGYSVLYTTDHANYSEAFAGSGETAVVRLVRAVLSAPEFSLILLDEPEVSLHPGAQKRLTTFLLEEIKKKKHQIVLTTHSPSLISELPKEAIKVLYQCQDTGRFAVKENLIPEEAFYHLENEINDNFRILFEDKLAKEIVDAVLKSLGPEKQQLFNLDYQPGGASVLYKNFAPIYCREENSKNYIVFDGDQNSGIALDHNNLPSNELSSNKLQRKIKDKISQEIVFAVDGNNGSGNEAQKVELYKKYIDYLNSNVFFLPLNIPEEIIWNSSIALNQLQQFSSEDAEDKLSELETITNIKTRFMKLSELINQESSSETIFFVQKMFIKAWLKVKDDNYNSIVDTINKITITL